METPITSSPSDTTKTFDLRPNEAVYDECFVVRETRYGLFISTTLEGRNVITGPTQEAVVIMTRFHLKGEQEGWPDGSTLSIHEGTVGGKL
tara:strand:- start:546 stop:818 length:273 start_codon:yes stop_codon:yes gene_type:complete